MRLFGTPSTKLIQSYRDALGDAVSVEGLPITGAELGFFRFKSQLLELPAETEQFEFDDLHFKTHPQSAFLSMVPASKRVELFLSAGLPNRLEPDLSEAAVFGEQLVSAANVPMLVWKGTSDFEHPRAIPVALITPADVQMRRAQLDPPLVLKAYSFPMPFSLVVKRFSFSPIRNDHQTLFTAHGAVSERRADRIQPVKSPEPPPTLKTADLEERLRWILTPPIHELLSDPQLALPHPPYPYQTQGIKWLFDRENGLLADEMGLGKTMQAIIAARLLWKNRQVKQILIICPKSLISNWRAELREWWPGIDCYTKVVGADRQWFLRDATKDVAVKIINYEALQRELEWLTAEERRPYHDLVIIDEAQRIKNPKSKSAQAVKALDAKRRWALTGTPLENSTDDVVSIFGFVHAGLISVGDSAQRIKPAIKPYMLRRRQEDVLPDLPARIPQEFPIELGDRQREAYDRAERQGVMDLNEKGDSITIAHVFALIQALRKICNVEPVSGESTKTDLLLEELEEIVENGRKALIFGQMVEEPYGLKRLATAIAEAKRFKGRPRPLQLHGQVPQRQRDGLIETFKNDPLHQVLLLNYSVGGVGLNLHMANYVFLFDRWWNPAVEDQAVKRCHRLGQKQTVFEKRFYCKDTIEERILTKLKEKRRLFNHVIDDDGNPTANDVGLSEEEIFALFNLKVRPRRSGEKARPFRIVLENIDDKQFENLVAAIYEKDGYKVRVSEGSHDHGIDIWAERSSGGGRDRIVIQCKHKTQNVGRPVVQQLWGVLHSDASLTRCDLVSSGGFTAEAKAFALGKRITLIDRGKLEEWARRLGVAEFVSH